MLSSHVREYFPVQGRIAPSMRGGMASRSRSNLDRDHCLVCSSRHEDFWRPSTYADAVTVAAPLYDSVEPVRPGLLVGCRVSARVVYCVGQALVSPEQRVCLRGRVRVPLGRPRPLLSRRRRGRILLTGLRGALPRLRAGGSQVNLSTTEGT